MIPKNEQCCGNCNAAIPDGQNTNSVYCRANPPTVIMMEKIILPNPKPQTLFHSQFPSMKEAGWCRQWQPKEYDG